MVCDKFFLLQKHIFLVLGLNEQLLFIVMLIFAFFLENYCNRPEHNVILDIDLIILKYIGMVIEPYIFKIKALNSQDPFMREILDTCVEI